MTEQQLQEEPASVVTGFAKDEKTRKALEITEDARQKEYTKPSFGAELFMGSFNHKLLFPFPEQSQEDKKIGDAYLEKLEKFLKENLDPEEVDRTREIPKKVIDGLVEMGAFALKVPKEYNGLGFSLTNYNRVVSFVCSYCGATGVLLSAHQSIGVPQPLKMYGTEDQKKKFFPRFRTGSISAFALTEPDVGSDPAEMATEAKLSDDGKHYILNGTKLWCTNGTIADIIVVMAKTAPKIIKGKERKQISAFILEMNTAGVEVVQRCEFMGLGGIYNAMIKFTNVKIPVKNRLSDEGRGLAMALATINVGRLTLPAASAGAAKQCLSIARRWGKSRVQWGQPVGLHEHGRQKIAYIASTAFATEAMALVTSNWQDRGDVDIRIEGSMAKLFSTESLWKIVDMTMQLRGGRGYEKARSLAARGEPPFGIERMMRDCRINMILEGSTEIMYLFMAREAIDPHLKRLSELVSPKLSIGGKLLSLVKSIGFYSWWFPAQYILSWFPSSYREMGELGKHYRFIESTAHKLARNLFFNMLWYREKLEKRQLLLSRLIAVGTDLFAMAATCSYAVHLTKKKPGDHTPTELADYFCTLARRRIEDNFHSLSDNDDRKTNKLAKEVIDGGMKWFEEGIMWVGPKE